MAASKQQAAIKTLPRTPNESLEARLCRIWQPSSWWRARGRPSLGDVLAMPHSAVRMAIRPHVGDNWTSTERSIVAATPLEPAIDRGEWLPQHGPIPP